MKRKSPPIRIELPTSFGMKTVNAYLFKEPYPVLVDCGEKTDASWESLEIALEKEGLTIGDLKQVVITHAHIDHMGMAGKIAANSDAEIWVSDLAYPWAVDFENQNSRRTEMILSVIQQMEGTQRTTMRDAFAQTFGAIANYWDSIPADRVKTFPIDGELTLGGAKWEVLYMPGHCPNQTCFYQREEEWLISADMLLNITATPVIDNSIESPEKRALALVQMLDSYERLLQYPIKQVFPGHYQSFTDAVGKINKQVARIHLRKEECFELIKAGIHDFFELFDRLYKGNRMNIPAFPMLVGYLDLLQEEGRIVGRMGNDKMGFYLV